MKKIIYVIVGAIVCDQLAKGILLYMITGGVPLVASAWTLVPYPYLMTPVASFFNIVFTWNPGVSFSMFRGLGESGPWVVILLTVVIIGLIIFYMWRRAAVAERGALALIVGGALGNLIDRLRFGAVIDFLDFHIAGWHWPAFNLADTFIFLGVMWLIIIMIKGKKNGKISRK